MGCADCTLFGEPRVKIRGKYSAPILLIGEAPGEQEAKKGYPFVGKSGKLLSGILKSVGLDESNMLITNIVMCRPPGNRTPTSLEAECCAHNLQNVLERMPNLQVIVPLGVTATTPFVGKMEMYDTRGVAYSYGGDVLIFPTYHPAAAFHDAEKLVYLVDDLKTVKAILDGYRPPIATTHDIKILEPTKAEFAEYLWAHDLIAVDTEWAQGGPWCATVSATPDEGVFIMHDNTDLLLILRERLATPEVTTLLHNALYDVPVLKKLGVYPSAIGDTMIMAHLLQTEPKSLKALTRRHLGMTMSAYKDVVTPAMNDKAMEYLVKAATMEWPELEPEVKIIKRKRKVYTPSNIPKRIDRIISDKIKYGARIDLVARWNKVKLTEGRGIVEHELGKIPEGDLSGIPLEEARAYAVKDAVATLLLHPILWGRIQERGLEEAYRLDIGAVPMIVSMMEKGILLDVDRLRALRPDLEADMEDQLTDIEGAYNTLVNPSSHMDVKWMAKQQNVELESTAAKYLNSVKGEVNSLDAVLAYREDKKLITTYINKLPYCMDSIRRVHTRYSITGTATGRLSSRDPNLQNIPVRNEKANSIREAFVTPDGYTFLSLDMSQAELRVVAHMSGDPLMIDILSNGGDIHDETACRIFKLPKEKLDAKRHRIPAKRVGFGILYGISAQGLAEQLNWDEIDCQHLIDSWYNVYQGVKQWIDDTCAFMDQYLFVSDMFGRTRLVPECATGIGYLIRQGHRQGVNGVIQIGAGNMLKKAMADLGPVIDVLEYPVHPILQIHDELVFELPVDKAEETGDLFKSVMENAVELLVPVRVDYKIADNWGGLK